MATTSGTGWAWYDEPAQGTWLGIERSQTPVWRVTTTSNISTGQLYYMNWPASSFRMEGIPTPDPDLALPEGF